MRGLCLNRLTNGPYVHFASGVRSRLDYFSTAAALCQQEISSFFKKSEKPPGVRLHGPQQHVQIQPDDAFHLAHLHALALGQTGQPPAVQTLELGHGRVIVGAHEGAVPGQVQRAALLQHLADELGAEIVAAAVPADVQRAEQQPHRVEAVKLAVVHHVVGAALGAGIGLIRHLQRIERTGDILPQPEDAPVEVFPAGPRREHGVAVFPGGAVQGGQVLIKGKGDMGILRPGQCVHQIRNQRSRTGQKDIKCFHRCTGSPPKFQTVDVLILRCFYSIT